MHEPTPTASITTASNVIPGRRTKPRRANRTSGKSVLSNDDDPAGRRTRSYTARLSTSPTAPSQTRVRDGPPLPARSSASTNDASMARP